MTEAVRVLTLELRAVRTDELLADECGQPRRHLWLVGRQDRDGAAVEHAALHRAALQDLTLAHVELIEARCEPLPADHRACEAARHTFLAADRDQAVGGDRLALALELERVDALDLNGIARQLQGLLAD